MRAPPPHFPAAPTAAAVAAAAVMSMAGAFLGGCRDGAVGAPEPLWEDTVAVPAPTPLALSSPGEFFPMPLTPENPLTVEGAALGEKLFHDPVLSLDSSLSCAACHRPGDAFADRGAAVSKGIRDRAGIRNSPALFNLAWVPLLFWDGRARSLEDQALHPVRDTNEMALPWDEAARRLRARPDYRLAFRKAFGAADIDSQLTVKALAQYQRTLLSSESRFDAWKAGGIELTDEEKLGYEVFNSDATHCSHCHREPMFTGFAFHDIGLDSLVEGTGLGGQTGNAGDMGKWRAPSLRNLGFTAPYMHDGRFATLAEVIDFYDSGGHDTPNLDQSVRNPSGTFPRQNALGITEAERKALLAFLATLDDSAFVARHSAPR